jgi:hypothetical protein
MQRLLQLPFNVCHLSFSQQTLAQTKLYYKTQPQYYKAQLQFLLHTPAISQFTTHLSFRALFNNDIRQIATVAELADFLIV